MSGPWAAAGAGKVLQVLGQCKGEASRRELVAKLTTPSDAEEAFKQSAVTLWSLALDGHRANNFEAKEGTALPVLSLSLANRLAKTAGASAGAAPAVGPAEAALSKARAAGESAKVAQASMDLAAAQVAQGNSEESLGAAAELLRQALQLVDKSGEAVCCNMLANVFLLMGQARDALRLAKQGLAALRAVGGKKILEVPLLQTMMSAYYLRQDSDEALRACQEVALLCKDAKDPAASALAAGCIAQAHLASDEQGLAERAAEAALQAARSAKDAEAEILLLGAVQEIALAIGKPVSAAKAAKELLEKEKKRGVKEAISRAQLLVSTTDLEGEGLKAAQQAKQQATDKVGEGLAAVSVANILLSQSKAAEAAAAAKEAFKAFEAAASSAGQGFALCLVALAQMRQEDVKATERAARDALALFQDAGHRVGQSLAELIVRKSQQLLQKPAECKIVIDDCAVAHVEISGICTPASLDQVLKALHAARCDKGVKAVVLLLQGTKGPVSAAYSGSSGGLAAPQTQAVASGSFLLGLRTLGLPCVAACCGKIAGPAWGLVLAADYRIASAAASFVLPLWGPPESFGDLVGHTVAMQLCYNQGPVSSLTMLEYGVIHQCQKGEEDTKKAAAEVARRIASTPNLACNQTTNMLSPAVEKYASIVARGGVRA